MADKPKPYNPNDEAKDPFVRVKDKETGRHVSVRQSTVDSSPELWQVLKRDAVNHAGEPLPPESPEHATPSGSADSGQKANPTPKEK